MSAAPRRKRAWEVALLLALAVVLVAALAGNVANLEPLSGSAPAVPPPTSPPPSTASGEDTIVLAVLWALTFGLFGGLVLLALRGRAETLRRRPSRRRSFLSSVVGFILILVLLELIPRSTPPLSPTATTSPGPGGASPVPVAPGVAAGWPVEAFFLIAVFGLIVGIAVRLRRRRAPFGDLLDPSWTNEEVRPAAAEALQETLWDLEVGADVRRAILACFHRFCRIVRTHGIVDQDPLTAREIEDLAVRTLGVSRETSAALTSLFEEARYSEHALSDRDRERAIESLGRIRAALEA